MKKYYKVQSINPHVALHRMRAMLLDEIVDVHEHLETHQLGVQGPARFTVLTGPCAGKQMVCSSICLEPLTLEFCLEQGLLCNCAGVKALHSPDTAGCYSEEEGPFCGKCGEPCEILEKHWTETEECWGAPVKRDCYEDISECCKVEELFLDCNLLNAK